MGVNSLPKTVTRQRRGCDLNPSPSAHESSTLTLGYRATARNKVHRRKSLLSSRGARTSRHVRPVVREHGREHSTDFRNSIENVDFSSFPVCSVLPLQKSPLSRQQHLITLVKFVSCWQPVLLHPRILHRSSFAAPAKKK